MSAQLPDQTRYTGFIPKDLYNSFFPNKYLYDQRGLKYPYHYYQYSGIPYKVYYGDPYTLIDYVDTATAVYNPAVGIPGISPNVVIVPGFIGGITPDMTTPGFGIPDPYKLPGTSTLVTPTVTPTVTVTPQTTTGINGGAIVGAWLGIMGSIVAFGAIRRRRKARR